MGEVIGYILGGGGLLAGVAAVITVFMNRRTSREDINIKHGTNVLEGYNELADMLQRQVAAVTSSHESLNEKYEKMSVTVERQGEQIVSLKIELRDRDDKIRLLTLDRDDLIAVVPEPRLLPALRTV
jgi:hypothetical protein